MQHIIGESTFGLIHVLQSYPHCAVESYHSNLIFIKPQLRLVLELQVSLWINCTKITHIIKVSLACVCDGVWKHLRYLVCSHFIRSFVEHLITASGSIIITFLLWFRERQLVSDIFESWHVRNNQSALWRLHVWIILTQLVDSVAAAVSE